MIERGGPQAALELLDQARGAIEVFEGGDGNEEVARVREPVGANGPRSGSQTGTVVLADIAARLGIVEDSTEPYAARDDARISPGAELEGTELGAHAHAAELRDDEELAVGTNAVSPIERYRDVEVDRRARAERRRAVATEREQAVDERGRRGRNRQRVPAAAGPASPLLGRSRSVSRPVPRRCA